MSLFLTQCHSQDKKETMQLKEYKYKNDTRIVYGIDLAVPGPYELYINDIKVRADYTSSMHNTLENINQAVLKSGTYSFRLVVFPMPSELVKGGIQPETVQFLKVGLSKYEKIPVGEGAMPDTYEYVQSYPIPKIDKPVPYLEIKGEFTVELPYELEGWSKGQDLRKMDQKVLQQKVVSYYQKLWNILNEGEGEAFNNLCLQRGQETIVFHYYPKEEIENNNKEEIKNNNEYKSMMLPIEDYKMKLYANGRLVTLERQNYTEEMNGKKINAKGKSPLIRNGKTKGVSFFPVKLYLPEGSNDFVIIRK